MINVLNKYKLKGDEVNAHYIGRGSVLGNPFSHLKVSKAEFTVSSRGEAVDKYEDHLRAKLNVDRDITREMVRLRKLFNEFGELNLVCYCHPKRCHGDVIKKLIEESLQ